MIKRSTPATPSKKKRPARSGSSAVRRPGPYGFRGRGLGESQILHPVREVRGTNYQLAGMYPFPLSGGAPIDGVPLGRHLVTGEPVCCDPITWFMILRLISNPSLFIMANPGLGKSSLIRRMAIVLTAFGIVPLVLGDTKGEHVEMIRAVDGSVFQLGRGVGHINPLDDGGAVAAARSLSTGRAEELLAELHQRRRSLLMALIAIATKHPLEGNEVSILDRCLHVVEQRFTEPDTSPVVEDLLKALRERHPEVREVALDRGSDDEYDRVTKNIEAGLTSLSGSGMFGDMFSKPSTHHIDPNTPMVFDLSRIAQVDSELRAATLLACWSAGQGSVTTSNMLADDGITERRRFLMVLDELWNTLAAGPGIVDQVNALTRLNREWGVGQIMASHTMSDLNAIEREADRHKARGIMDRCGMKILGGLARSEMPALTESIQLSVREQDQLANWQDPPAWNRASLNQTVFSNDDLFVPAEDDSIDDELAAWLSDPENSAWHDAMMAGRTEVPPPGQGKFLIKVGSRPGVPFQMEFTPTEQRSQIHNTQKKWMVGKAKPSTSTEGNIR